MSSFFVAVRTASAVDFRAEKNGRLFGGPAVCVVSFPEETHATKGRCAGGPGKVGLAL